MLKLAFQGKLEAFQTRVVEELFLWLVLLDLLGTEVQRSLESSWIGFQIDQPYIMQAKYFSHIGCNRRQDRNEIIIWINQTLFFQEKSLAFCSTTKVVPPFCILAGNTSDGDGSLGMNGTTVSNGTRPSPINISRRSFRNFLESFGKWKTPCISTFTRGSRNIFPWPLVKKGIR